MRLLRDFFQSSIAWPNQPECETGWASTRLKRERERWPVSQVWPAPGWEGGVSPSEMLNLLIVLIIAKWYLSLTCLSEKVPAFVLFFYPNYLRMVLNFGLLELLLCNWKDQSFYSIFLSIQTVATKIHKKEAGTFFSQRFVALAACAGVFFREEDGDDIWEVHLLDMKYQVKYDHINQRRIHFLRERGLNNMAVFSVLCTILNFPAIQRNPEKL